MTNLENLLNNTDFSQDSRNREAIKIMLLNTLKREEQKKHAKGGSMKNFRVRPKYAVAVAVVVSVGILIAACGDDMVKIVQHFTVGRYATFAVSNDGGNVRYITEEARAGEFTETVFVYEEKEREEGVVTYFDTIDDVKPYLAFNPLIPTFAPDGFALDRISLYNDENGKPLPLGSNMYLNVYYTNADKTQEIYIQIRVMGEETAFIASATHDMSHIPINGHEGIVDGKNVFVEIDGVMYMIMAGRAVGATQDDVISMAASLR